MLAGAYSRGGTRKFQRCLFCSIARRGPCGGTGTEFGCRRSLAMINTPAIAAGQGQAASDLALANSGASDVATDCQERVGSPYTPPCPCHDVDRDLELGHADTFRRLDVAAARQCGAVRGVADAAGAGGGANRRGGGVGRAARHLRPKAQ